MRIGLLTDALADLSVEEMLDWADAEATLIRDVEIGTGGFSPTPHCALSEVLEDASARARWEEGFTRRGITIAALNVSGNPLHPDPKWAARDDAALRDTIQLATALGVERVVAMSGCPGLPGGPAPAPHFIGGGLLPDFEGFLDWQWQEQVLPYWRRLSAFALDQNPQLQICLELHPGACVYNAPTYEWITQAGPNLAVNLDPSHFFWQGMDPLVMVNELGGAIGFVHAKDTRFSEDNCARVGVLDCRMASDPTSDPSQWSWNFSTVGHAHDAEWWGRFIGALADAGYDGVLSIECEDPFLDAKTSVLESMACLDEAIQLTRTRPT